MGTYFHRGHACCVSKDGLVLDVRRSFPPRRCLTGTNGTGSLVTADEQVRM